MDFNVDLERCIYFMKKNNRVVKPNKYGKNRMLEKPTFNKIVKHLEVKQVNKSKVFYDYKYNKITTKYIYD